ncbi:MAG TPA: isoprenylcysteine carboxylmethyltransferase family protein [Stellaceae bacterium]|nr:isoprenylcysteine carboxylmethyltransferase family protein [Stellaceae bacterium]
MTLQQRHLARIPRRRFADLVLFAFTCAEFIALILLTPQFDAVDWIYVLQNLLVLGIALTRRAPIVQDRSLPSAIAVTASIAYPYAQVIVLARTDGYDGWPAGGFVLIALAACLSLASLLSLGRYFGFRPALRGVATHGTYAFVRHPMYLAYFVSDIGYELNEWNVGTILLVLAGWASLIYRIDAEERILSQSKAWPAYASAVRYRLFPGLW